jgi:predicted nuclease with TOPRIM domain
MTTTNLLPKPTDSVAKERNELRNMLDAKSEEYESAMHTLSRIEKELDQFKADEPKKLAELKSLRARIRQLEKSIEGAASVATALQDSPLSLQSWIRQWAADILSNAASEGRRSEA